MLIVLRGQDYWEWGVCKPEISSEESFWLEFNKSIEMVKWCFERLA